MSLRVEPFVIVGAVVTVAVSVAVTLWAGAGLAWSYAALTALLVTAMMIPLALRSSERGPPAPAPGAILRVESGLASLSRRLSEVEQRLIDLDKRMMDVSRSTVRAVASELDTVGSVMRDLAEAVAMHDAELFAPRQAPSAAPGTARPAAVSPAERPAPVSAVRTAEPESGPAARFTTEEVDAVARAIQSGQVELMLQAIVTLPQRRVRLYEAQARVRTPSGVQLEATTVSAIADLLGRSRELDRFVLHHLMRVARHLAQRNRDVPVVFRAGTTTLLDAGIFRQLSQTIADDPGFASRILFEVPMATFRDAGAIEREALEALEGLGIRFVLDSVPDLVIEARSLAQRGVRYVRVAAETLLGAVSGAVRAEIHPADLAGYLARHGMSLVVEGVETEAVSVELFEFDIPLGIGPLYAPPRTVRMDVLDEPAPEAGEPPAKEAARPAPEERASRAPGPGDRGDASPPPATQARGTPLRAFLKRTSG